jgi:hypothetical protein
MLLLKENHVKLLASECQTSCMYAKRARAGEANQVNLMIISDAFCIVQRETVQSQTGLVRGYGVAEAPPVVQAGWSDCK